ncbi:MAG: mechanosensitive ion channel [Symploca sp. SIO3C6]|uniref:Mechanosensitive ion channel n=1 Tax=Symploca sp. SIO1C4 TaxID=2607765 RepID=A0A6B3N790_9CYAN|nr:mechanosensitive ion channel [Symploca sp. SIO3C6]NER27413.1 mechanosensitive ion channel [Symploca sp. SIO1C4]NET05576.1 mechanosensitive ion channel [Symploca sp. SIO2B6]NET48093.1 mechanosensitive ion channel [Merismopedia sp. SIO2A8]
MNIYNDWEGIVQIVGVGAQLRAQSVLAQGATPGGFVGSLGAFLPNVIGAIFVLVIGIIVALIASGITRGLLNRTNVDNNIANWITNRQAGAEAPKVEKLISGAVFWIVIVFTVVAVLQTLQLEVVSLPLNSFLDQIIGFLPKILGAGALLALAWLLATVVKLLVAGILGTFGLDERLNEQINSTSESSTDNQLSISQTIGNFLYWFIFLLFLPSVLSTLGLQGTLLPVQELLNEILAILPNILGATLIAVIGWLIAQIVRRVVTNLLAAAGADQLGDRLGLSPATSARSLSWVLGTVVYVLILIPVAIAALNELQIDAISGPAILMLEEILGVLPNIFFAALILIIAYAIGRFVSELVTNILTGIGFNNIFEWLGIPSAVPSATEETLEAETPTPSTGQQTVLQTPDDVTARTPSEWVGLIVLVVIMLFAVVAATDVLQVEPLTLIVSQILTFALRIVVALVIFAIGLFLANLAFNLITVTGSRQSKIVGQAARIAIIALVTAMALRQIGIASDIINLAFGLLLGAIAVAIALSFGLGTRDIAANQVREWLASFKDNKTD